MVVLNNILLLLKAQNKKQIDLTNYLGLSKNVFTEWKAGKNTSYKKHLPEIAQFFNVSVDFILGSNLEETSGSIGFTYALYNELTHDLSQDQLEQVKKFADFLRKN